MENASDEINSSINKNKVSHSYKDKDNEKNGIKENEKERIFNGSFNKLEIESCKNIISYTSINNLDIGDAQKKGEIDKKDEFNSENNLSNLSKLYGDYLKKIDSSKIFQRTKRQRSIYIVGKNIRHNTFNERNDNNINEENDSINLYNIIKDRLTEVKQDTLHYLDKTKQKLELKYNYFIKKINELLIEKEKNLSKLLGGNNKNDNFINYANNNLFKQIDDILEIHENIFSALEDHFNLLYSFLEQTSLIQQKKPIEYFINNFSSDILNCWFLNKIDFNQINLSSIISNKELSDLCAGYLSKMNNNIYPSLSIKKDKEGNLPLEIEILYKNVNKLNKIKFIGLNSEDFTNILQEIKNKYKHNLEIKNNNENRKSAKKLKNLSIIDSNLFIDKLPKIDFPSLKKFRLKNSFITFSYLFDYIFGETSSLMQIYIENIKMTDNSLKVFFNYLSSKKSILETLKNLSFKRNNLTKVNLQNFNMENGQFKNLQFLNISKNNLYEFSPENFKIMPELKVLDLTDNNISNSLLFDAIMVGEKISKFISLLANNIFIHNNRKNNYQYIKYLSEKLSVFEHKIKKISFCLLFNKDNLQQFTKLKISPAVKISICKLDLSFCGLHDENLWKFFRNNFGLLNLEELNLSNNFLTDNVFNLCSGLQGDILMEKLYMIDLSGNKVECRNISDLKALDTFIDNHKELKKVKLQQTSFVQGFKKLIEGKNCKDEINNIIHRLLEKNIKLIIETELDGDVRSNKILKNMFSYKNKTY